jgi:hypothetical protein
MQTGKAREWSRTIPCCGNASNIFRPMRLRRMRGKPPEQPSPAERDRIRKRLVLNRTPQCIRKIDRANEYGTTVHISRKCSCAAVSREYALSRWGTQCPQCRSARIVCFSPVLQPDVLGMTIAKALSHVEHSAPDARLAPASTSASSARGREADFTPGPRNFQNLSMIGRVKSARASPAPSPARRAGYRPRLPRPDPAARPSPRDSASPGGRDAARGSRDAAWGR